MTEPAGSNPQSTNFEKFQTGNPVVRRLIAGFYAEVADLVTPLAPDSLLDAGCGEGETLARLEPLLPADVFAVDLEPEAVAYTRGRIRGIQTSVESVYSLPFPDSRFDVVLCLEVLEHLEHPGSALEELRRVAKRALIVSVPHEPWFRIGSLLRGKYMRTWGNHPEHVNHWNGRTFADLLHGRFSSVELRRSAPWLIAGCRL